MLSLYRGSWYGLTLTSARKVTGNITPFASHRLMVVTKLAHSDRQGTVPKLWQAAVTDQRIMLYTNILWEPMTSKVKIINKQVENRAFDMTTFLR